MRSAFLSSVLHLLPYSLLCSFQFVSSYPYGFALSYLDYLPYGSSSSKPNRRENRNQRNKKALTDRKILDSFSKLKHNTRSLVSQNTVALNNQRANTSSLPKVDIRSVVIANISTYNSSDSGICLSTVPCHPTSFVL